MHEMSYVNRVVNLAFEIVKENKLRHVKELQIEVGAMAGIVPELMEKCYRQAVAGTVLEGSKLTMTPKAVTAKCDDCGTTYEPNRGNDYCCPNCKSHKSQIIGGRKVVLEQLLGD
ncbi:MAG: hydrogenase maturation nickel metallochaperone HypA [Lachnospiraceae bacterium]|nr:hydrogenase maturation nickel metallochaperone HypA [Lachnospiraceae bacterium]